MSPDFDDAICTWAYDSLGRTVAETLQIGSGTKRIVTASQTSLRRASLVYPNDRQVNYAYHAGGALASLTDDGAGSAIAAYHYIGGRTLKRTMQNGVNLDLTNGSATYHDASGQPTHWIHTGTNPGSTPTSLDFQYGYDAAGNKLFQHPAHDGRDAQRYAYDSSGRLTGFSRGDFNASGSVTRGSSEYCDAPTTATWTAMDEAQKWTLDGVGNWSGFVRRRGGTTLSETRDDNTFNAYTTIHGPGGNATLTHDANETLTSSGTLQLKWDSSGRMREARNGGGSLIATYYYDTDNRRVRKAIAGGAVTDFFYDGWRVLEERNGSTGVIQRQFVYGNYLDEVLVMDVYSGATGYNAGQTLGATAGSFAPLQGATRYFYHQNTLFSVCAVTDSTGKIVEAYEYDPYGRHVLLRDGNADGRVNFNSTDTRTLLGASAIGNSNTFTGQRYDAETALHYYKERYYGCSLGRFVSRDELYKDGPCLYQYVKSMPTAAGDPLGLWAGGDHTKITQDSFDALLTPKNEKEKQCYNKVKGMLVGANLSIDSLLGSFWTYPLHYNRDTVNYRLGEAKLKHEEELAKAAKDEYRTKLTTRQNTFKNAKYPKDCIKALTNLGQASHMWQDYYAHGVDTVSGGYENLDEKTMGSPADLQLWPSSYDVIATDDHSDKGPETKAGQLRRRLSRAYTESGFGGLPNWMKKCKCEVCGSSE